MFDYYIGNKGKFLLSTFFGHLYYSVYMGENDGKFSSATKKKESRKQKNVNLSLILFFDIMNEMHLFFLVIRNKRKKQGIKFQDFSNIILLYFNNTEIGKLFSLSLTVFVQ